MRFVVFLRMKLEVVLELAVRRVGDTDMFYFCVCMLSWTESRKAEAGFALCVERDAKKQLVNMDDRLTTCLVAKQSEPEVAFGEAEPVSDVRRSPRSPRMDPQKGPPHKSQVTRAFQVPKFLDFNSYLASSRAA